VIVNVRSKIFKFALLLGVVIAFSVGMLYYYSSVSVKGPIYDFVYERDSQSILKIFDKDWYWLVEESRETYSAEFMLTKRSRDKNPKNFGTLIIKVAQENDQLAGFVAYYRKSLVRGCLLFLGVADEFKRKGYGKQLAEYAVKDMLSMKMSVIELVTRVNNTRARSLYKKLGFKEVKIEGGFVTYEYWR